jgi:hypothetical protein
MAVVAEAGKPDVKRERPEKRYRLAFWWVMVIAYSAVNILAHEQVNDFAKWLIQVMGLSPFFWSTRILTVAGVLVILFCRRHFLRQRERLKAVVLFIVIGLALDMSLVIFASERVHYPQYALLTWIAYPAIGKPLPAALLSFLVGYVDEAHQHWIIYAKDQTAYFDWNDNVLNLLGAVSTLVLLPEGSIRKSSKRSILAATVIWIATMVLLVWIFKPDAALMRAHHSSSFWLTSGVNTHYHVLNALEGTILLGVSWIVIIGYYLPADAQGINRRRDREYIKSKPPESDSL